jgi:DNA-binding XRE family transcriptional regulator
MTPEKIQEFYSEMGELIKTARISAELNQEILAQQLGLTRASIVNIEKGRQRPMIHTILQLAEILHTTADKLIPGLTPGKKDNIANSNGVDNFENMISDATIDFLTKDAVKKFVSHIKK